MVVWFAHVRVGHRQLSIPDLPPTSYLVGGFSLATILKPLPYALRQAVPLSTHSQTLSLKELCSIIESFLCVEFGLLTNCNRLYSYIYIVGL